MNNLYRRLSIDASYQVSYIWHSGFRGEDFLEIDQSEQELPVVAMFVNELRRNEQSS